MRTLAHLSDLHFGRVDARVLEPLRMALRAIGPDLVVVSGDLTQRARSSQFREARAFLDSLPFARLVIPGNHDIPLYNVARRILAPLRGYRRIVDGDLAPVYVDAEIVVAGVNTARSLAFKGGRIGASQLARLRALLGAEPASKTKIVVTHHPFDGELAKCGADLLLSGHLHEAEVALSAGGAATLVVQAGTATSSRTRESPNSFNVLRIEPGRIGVETLRWNGGGFEIHEARAFERVASRWKKSAAAP